MSKLSQFYHLIVLFVCAQLFLRLLWVETICQSDSRQKPFEIRMFYLDFCYQQWYNWYTGSFFKHPRPKQEFPKAFLNAEQLWFSICWLRDHIRSSDLIFFLNLIIKGCLTLWTHGEGDCSLDFLSLLIAAITFSKFLFSNLLYGQIGDI